jgi:hypothetical protein
MGNVLLIGLILLFVISLLYAIYNTQEYRIALNLNLMNTPYYKIGLFSSRTFVYPTEDNDENIPFIQDEIVIGLLIIEIELTFYKELEA